MTATDKKIKVAIIGAGSIAFGSATLLHSRGHDPILWSPSGAGTKAFQNGTKLTAEGAVEIAFVPHIAKTAKDAIQQADVILIAVPAFAHKDVMDGIAPYIESRQTVLISSHASFGALYLSKLLAARKVLSTIVAWGTTLITGRKTSDTQVNIKTVRDKIDIATVPHDRSNEGVDVCRALFGDRFVARDGLMAIALSNLNPQNHMGMALCNLTRMEKGEDWDQYMNTTPAVGRLLEALDVERLAIAAKIGVEVRDIFEHFNLSFHVPKDSISNMCKAVADDGRGGFGPNTLDSRYVYEDVPYGLVPTAYLGKLAGKPARLHESGVAIFNGLYGRDFELENNLMAALELDSMSLEQLIEFSREGAQFEDDKEAKTA
jgi:opine dehydrogenase